MKRGARIMGPSPLLPGPALPKLVMPTVGASPDFFEPPQLALFMMDALLTLLL